MELKGKTILITGAAQGIGRALAERLTQEEADLVLVDRQKDKLEDFVAKHDKKYRHYECDLSDHKNVMQLVGMVEKDFSKLDILVNVAGIGVYKNIYDVSFNEWANSLAINVTAPFLLVQGLLPLLQKGPDSLVLNIGSGMGTIPTAGRSVYCSTKFALRGLTLSLAEEFRGKSPNFCLITLGSTLTTFGMSIEEKRKRQAQGQPYFEVDFVANKLVEIIKDDGRQTEVVLFPGDYGESK